jgi:thiamine kinase-like enzyme
MPYFVYRIQEKPRKLDHMETFPSYKDAKVYVREQRQQSEDVESIRMIFAHNDIEAEKLLSTPREERVIGED